MYKRFNVYNNAGLIIAQDEYALTDDDAIKQVAKRSNYKAEELYAVIVPEIMIF